MGKLISWLGSALMSILGLSAKTMATSILIVGVVFLSLWGFGLDLFFELLSLFFSFIGNILSKTGFNVPAFNLIDQIKNMDSVTVNILAYLHFDECFKMILSALMTRIALNSIPFVRL